MNTKSSILSAPIQTQFPPAELGLAPHSAVALQTGTLSQKKALIAYFLDQYFNQPLTKLSLAALGKMVPGIGGYVQLPNGIASATEFCGAGSIAYSGMTRLGQDVFNADLTPNTMLHQLQNTWLPEMLDTDPTRLLFPVLGGALVNDVEVADYDPTAFVTSLNFGGAYVDDNGRQLLSTGRESLPILAYRLFVKAVDNHVGDARITLTGWDTSVHAEPTAEDMIYRLTLQMGVTAVSDFSGLITVLPLKKTGLVNIDGSVSTDANHVRHFSGRAATRLQNYEVILNDCREESETILQNFTLSISGSNVQVYLMPIYPLKSDYEALAKLIQNGRIHSYLSYLHLLGNTQS